MAACSPRAIEGTRCTQNQNPTNNDGDSEQMCEAQGAVVNKSNGGHGGDPMQVDVVEPTEGQSSRKRSGDGAEEQPPPKRRRASMALFFKYFVAFSITHFRFLANANKAK